MCKPSFAARLLAVAAFFEAGVSYAVPSPYVSKFGKLNIVNQTNATVIRDSDVATRMYVLPPLAGTATFKNFVRSSNLLFCDSLANTVKSMSRIDEQIVSLGDQFNALKAEHEAAEKKTLEAREELGKVAQAEGAAKFMALSMEIENMSDKVSEVLTKMETCTEHCDVLRQEYASLRDDIKTAREHLRALESQYSADVKVYKIAENRVKQAEINQQEVGGRINRLSAQLSSLGATVANIFSTRGQLEGGTALVNYSTGWDEAVAKLRSDNPQYEFTPISTKNAKIFATFMGAGSQSSYLQTLPAVLDYVVNGRAYQPWNPANTDLEALPSVLAAGVRMSVIGACPIVMNDFFKDSHFDVKRDQSGAPEYAITATYQYPAAYRVHVKASYNMYKFFEQIRTKGTSGGFFSSRSYSEIVENKRDTDAFKIDWTVEDPDSIYDEKMRLQVTKEIKAELLDRALRMIAQPVIAPSNSAQFYDAGAPPESGAVVFAKGLRSTCGFNIYCQGASWLLSGLQAIFGSSRTEETFRQTYDVTSTYEMDSLGAVDKTGAITMASH